jgi:hypothetical protein
VLLQSNYKCDRLEDAMNLELEFPIARKSSCRSRWAHDRTARGYTSRWSAVVSKASASRARC